MREEKILHFFIKAIFNNSFNSIYYFDLNWKKILPKFKGRQLAHCWELAGGGSMSNLLEISLINSRIIQFPIIVRPFPNSPKFSSFSLLLFIDLTRPETIQSLVDPLLAVCRKRLELLAPSLGESKVPSTVGDWHKSWQIL